MEAHHLRFRTWNHRNKVFFHWGMEKKNVWAGPPSLSGNHPGNLLELTDEICPFQDTNEKNLFVGDIVMVHYHASMKESICTIGKNVLGYVFVHDGIVEYFTLIDIAKVSMLYLGNHREHDIDEFKRRLG